ncbi:hypothetical protein GO495_09395 [Chitinophaga oryziterrae]|jgi:hypothetical protein|uniref:Uncharacterized protein n=1 Tax=Chitinophaga oryziterrae TaxID=1031224 RepID=A0A6N8J858_9BACT|nr:hypothetical protein [Chitinophaga oryziterrae]
MKKVKNHDIVADLRKVRDSMSLKHWKNPELFMRKLEAAANRRREEVAMLDRLHYL